MLYLKKLNLKSKYKFIENRTDKISIGICIFLLGFYFGNSVKISLYLILFFLGIIVLLFYYRHIFNVFLVIFIGSFIFSGIIFGISFPVRNEINGNFNYIGDTKVLTVNKILWLNEKIVIENKIFPKSEKSLLARCNNYKLNPYVDFNLNSQGIRYSVFCSEQWNFYTEPNIMDNMNQNFQDVFSVFSRDVSDLLKGITLGTKPSKELNTAFQQVGLSHIIVVSGFNITLILSVISNVLSFLDKKYKIFIVLISVLFFVMLVGPSGPVIRAGIMGTLGFLSMLKWKNISYMRLLLISAVLMIVNDPYAIYNVSFQLSFFAMFGMILFGKYFSNLFRFLPNIIAEPVSQSLAAGVFTIPFATMVFSSFSPSFIISNLLILPLIGFLTIFSYLFIFFPNPLLGQILEKCADVIIQITLYLSSFKNSTIAIGLNDKIYFIYFLMIFLLLSTVIYITKKLLYRSRIEKKRIIEYYSCV